MEFFGLSPIEMVVIVVVAVLVFGARLPQVAGETAAMLQKLRRALADLRRESGIDQEIYRARRDFEDSVRKPLREADVANTIKREAAEARKVLDAATRPPTEEPKPVMQPTDAASEPDRVAAPQAPEATPSLTPPAAEDPSGPDRG